MIARARNQAGRTAAPRRRLSISILAAAFVMTACGGQGIAPSTESVATSGPSGASTTAADPSPTTPPAALPAGRLVYGQWIGDVGTIFTSNPDGTDITPLLPTGTGEQPRWSPDGRHISIVAENGDGLVFVGLIDPDGSHYVQFDSPGPRLNLGCLAWSPDGSRLACEGWDDTDLSRNGIYTVRSSDGGDLARVTTSPDGAHDIPTDYSPDGHQIVFVRGKPGDEANSTLMVVNVDGSGARALSDQNLRQGRWSPDGKTILSGAGAEAETAPARADRRRRDQDDRDPFGRQPEDGVLRKLVPRWRVDRLLRQDLERCRSLHRAGGRHAPPSSDRHTRQVRGCRRVGGAGTVMARTSLSMGLRRTSAVAVPPTCHANNRS